MMFTAFDGVEGWRDGAVDVGEGDGEREEVFRDGDTRYMESARSSS